MMKKLLGQLFGRDDLKIDPENVNVAENVPYFNFLRANKFEVVLEQESYCPRYVPNHTATSCLLRKASDFFHRLF